MKVTFDKWIRKVSSHGPYYIQYFCNENGKPMGWIRREVEQPWPDCNTEITTHYEVRYWLNRNIEQPIDIFPVLDAAGDVTDLGWNMDGYDYRNPDKVAELHAHYLATYFPDKNVGEASHAARSAGTKAKRFIKELAKKGLLIPIQY